MEEWKEDTPLDEYPAPDPTVPPVALADMGHVRDSFLPLSAERARKPADDLTVYAALHSMQSTKVGRTCRRCENHLG